MMFDVPSLSPRAMWFVGVFVGAFALIGFFAVTL
jgi:hypothetical protein